MKLINVPVNERVFTLLQVYRDYTGCKTLNSAISKALLKLDDIPEVKALADEREIEVKNRKNK
jgi:hypothetical protein